MIKDVLIALLLITLLSGCESLKLKNIAKTGATTTVAYAVGGAIPAVANVVTSVTVDEVIPADQNISEIETKEQAVAHVATEWGYNALIGFIAFLLITNVLVPWLASKRGYAKAKDKYNVRISKDIMDQIRK